METKGLTDRELIDLNNEIADEYDRLAERQREREECAKETRERMITATDFTLRLAVDIAKISKHFDDMRKIDPVNYPAEYTYEGWCRQLESWWAIRSEG